MASTNSAPTISLRERSFTAVEAGEKLSRWVVFSLLLHSALIISLFVMPFFPPRKAPAYPVYSVDLVGGEKLGGTNLGTELAPAPEPKKAVEKKATEAPVPVAEPKKPVKEKAEKKVAAIEEKAKVKEKATKEPALGAKDETKADTASLDSVRGRLLQSAVDRAKIRAEAKPQPVKGETINSGPGEGEGAAALGAGGRGGGVVKGMEFIIYQNRMLSTIKNNWVWVGQRGNLKVIVHFSIRENGEITGLKIMQPSGNPSYDESVLRAVQKSSPLPAPPENFRKDFSDVELAFRPEDLGT